MHGDMTLALVYLGYNNSTIETTKGVLGTVSSEGVYQQKDVAWEELKETQVLAVQDTAP